MGDNMPMSIDDACLREKVSFLGSGRDARHSGAKGVSTFHVAPTNCSSPNHWQNEHIRNINNNYPAL